MLWRHIEAHKFAGDPIPMAADGAFVTPRLEPGAYVLVVVRTPHSATSPATTVGFTSVVLGTADVTGVTVEVRRDSALTGRFRMESDNPRAPWPTYMAVLAFLDVGDRDLWMFEAAAGGPGGTFVLRNIFGPRILSCNITPAAGSPWWLSRVLLDGRDVTHVPTDFSQHPNGQLEVVFTQHPARIAGTVIDAAGKPARGAWILLTVADPASRRFRSIASDVAQAGANGTFTIAVPPATYRVEAFPADRFASWQAARAAESRPAVGAVAAVAKERETSNVRLTVQAR